MEEQIKNDKHCFNREKNLAQIRENNRELHTRITQIHGIKLKLTNYFNYDSFCS